MAQPTNPAGWHPDPAGSGRLRYFDGVQWTDQYAQTYTTVYSAPTPVDPTPKPAGWYPDPRGGTQRRYWDGNKWTEHQAEAELPAAPRTISKGVLKWGAVAGVVIAAVVAAFAASNGKGPGTGFLQYFALIVLMGGLLYAMFVGVALAFRSDAKRKRRQQDEDRKRALIINADAEHNAYLGGDDRLGVYGQFPPPPEVHGDGDR